MFGYGFRAYKKEEIIKKYIFEIDSSGFFVSVFFISVYISNIKNMPKLIEIPTYTRLLYTYYHMRL